MYTEFTMITPPKKASACCVKIHGVASEPSSLVDSDQALAQIPWELSSEKALSVSVSSWELPSAFCLLPSTSISSRVHSDSDDIERRRSEFMEILRSDAVLVDPPTAVEALARDATKEVLLVTGRGVCI
mmetsp:Transcript_4489/g.12657  ORF Transcript_4489/g.12657 Transcript_4489/m.12657 type:complete len:129 (+) Transcript_4489:510-896(+)